MTASPVLALCVLLLCLVDVTGASFAAKTAKKPKGKKAAKKPASGGGGFGVGGSGAAGASLLDSVLYGGGAARSVVMAPTAEAPRDGTAATRRRAAEAAAGMGSLYTGVDGPPNRAAGYGGSLSHVSPSSMAMAGMRDIS